MENNETAAWLREALDDCNECGWSGVVLEYLPAFEIVEPMAAFGTNGALYCPQCGEPLAD